MSFYGLPAERVPVVYNGTDLTRCLDKTDYAAADPVKLLHIGRFDGPKNHEGLLRSFAKIHTSFPNTLLTMVGDGALREPMEALAEELGIRDGVEFAGMQENVYPYLHDADIFLLPSSYEGIPMTIVEAMGTGLPIVATAVGGVPDLIRNGENGLLVPCDTDAVADACIRLMQDAALRERLGCNARKDSTRFSANHMAESYIKVYQS